jgi:hypothetical protein
LGLREDWIVHRRKEAGKMYRIQALLPYLCPFVFCHSIKCWVENRKTEVGMRVSRMEIVIFPKVRHQTGHSQTLTACNYSPFSLCFLYDCYPTLGRVTGML